MRDLTVYCCRHWLLFHPLELSLDCDWLTRVHKRHGQSWPLGNCSCFLHSLHGPLGLHRQQSILHHPRSGLTVQEWKVTRDFSRSKASPIHSGGVILLARMSGAVAVMA